MISAEEYTQKWIRKSAMAFLEGKKNVPWIVGVIRTSGIEGQALKAILDGLKDYDDANRYQQLLASCREQGWFN